MDVTLLDEITTHYVESLSEELYNVEESLTLAKSHAMDTLRQHQGSLSEYKAQSILAET